MRIAIGTVGLGRRELRRHAFFDDDGTATTCCASSRGVPCAIPNSDRAEGKRLVELRSLEILGTLRPVRRASCRCNAASSPRRFVSMVIDGAKYSPPLHEALRGAVSSGRDAGVREERLRRREMMGSRPLAEKPGHPHAARTLIDDRRRSRRRALRVRRARGRQLRTERDATPHHAVGLGLGLRTHDALRRPSPARLRADKPCARRQTLRDRDGSTR